MLRFHLVVLSTSHGHFCGPSSISGPVPTQEKMEVARVQLMVLEAASCIPAAAPSLSILNADLLDITTLYQVSVMLPLSASVLVGTRFKSQSCFRNKRLSTSLSLPFCLSLSLCLSVCLSLSVFLSVSLSFSLYFSLSLRLDLPDIECKSRFHHICFLSFRLCTNLISGASLLT